MLVAFAVLTVTPVSTLLILPRRLSALVLLATAGIAGPCLAAHFATKAAKSAPALSAVAVTLAANTVVVALALYLSLWYRLEDNFDSWPWAVEQQRLLAAKETGAFACPFTGALGSLRDWQPAVSTNVMIKAYLYTVAAQVAASGLAQLQPHGSFHPRAGFACKASTGFTSK